MAVMRNIANDTMVLIWKEVLHDYSPIHQHDELEIFVKFENFVIDNIFHIMIMNFVKNGILQQKNLWSVSVIKILAG